MRLARLYLLATLAWCTLGMAQATPAEVVVPAGTRILLVLNNSISSKNAKAGNLVQFETAFPVAVEGRIVIPAGSRVTGEVAKVKRPGRVKGKGEIEIRFARLQLVNGEDFEFPATLSAIDANNPGKKSKKGNVQSASGGEAKKVGKTSAKAAAAAAAETGGLGVPVGIVVGTGVAVVSSGLTLLTRGPDVNLPRGMQLEAQLVQELSITPAELATPQ